MTRRWWTGAVPTLGIVVLALVMSAAVSPTFRREVSMSVQRHPEVFVELAFADPVAAKRCETADGVHTLRLEVRSHPEGTPVDLRATASVDGRVVDEVDAAAPQTGRAAEVVLPVSVPSGQYRLEVSVVGRPERLALSCPGGPE